MTSLNVKVTTRETDKLREKVDARRRAALPIDDARAEFDRAHGALRDGLDAVLAEINGRATAHTLSGSEVINVAAGAERVLDARGVTKANRVGAVLTHIPAGPGKAYSRKSRSVVSTAVHLRRVADGWRMIRAEKVDVWATSPERFQLQVSQAAAADIEKAAFAQITVAA